MSATTTWNEANGTTATNDTSTTNNVDWKSVNDRTSTPTEAPIIAGENSYHKNTFLAFSGTFTQISNVKFGHTAGSIANCSLKALVTATYTAPATTALSGSTDITTANPISTSSIPVTVGDTPSGATGSALTSAGTTCFLVTQLQTTTLASAGLIGQQTLTVQYDEQ